jgi:predicted small lipoprotein YifL
MSRIQRSSDSSDHRDRGRSLASRAASCVAATPLLLAAGLGIAACGARGPLDDTPLDAGTTADVAVAEPIDAAPQPDAAPPFDAAPEGGSILGCGTCLVGKCSQGILACVQDTVCRTTFQCVATTCLSGGAPDAACLFKCASGDVQGALKIFTIFQCVTATCGGDCGSVLSGLLGGLGGLGGGGAGGGGAPPPPPKREARVLQSKPAFVTVIEQHWPELCPPDSVLP